MSFFFQYRLKLDPALSQVVFIRAVVSGFQLMTIIYQYIVLYGCIVWIIIYTYIPLFPACRFFFANEKRIWLIFTNGRKWNFRVLNTHTYIHTVSCNQHDHSRFGTKAKNTRRDLRDWVTTTCANILTIHYCFHFW